VTCVPGKSVCTASARTCAASWRMSSSALGSSRVTTRFWHRSSRDRRGRAGTVKRHRDGSLGRAKANAFGDSKAADAGLESTRLRRPERLRKSWGLLPAQSPLPIGVSFWFVRPQASPRIKSVNLERCSIRMESSDRKVSAQTQRVGACLHRKSRATFSDQL